MELVLEPLEHVGENPFGFGHGKPTQGQGGTGDPVAGEQGRCFGRCQSQPAEGLANGGPLGRSDVAEQQVLVWGEPHLQFVSVHEVPQPRFELSRETAAQHGQAHKPQLLVLAMPTQVVLELCLGFLAQALDGMGEIIGLQFCFEPGHPPVMDQVFHPSVATLLAVAEIPLQGEDGLHQIEHVPIGHIAEGIGGAGKGFFLVVGAAHAAPHVHIAAHGPALGIAEQHQPDVLGQQVHGVIAGHRDGHLELAGQVGVAIEGLLAITTEDTALLLALLHLLDRCTRFDSVAEFAINPEIQVGAFGGLGGQEIGNLVSQVAGRRIATVLEWGCRGHHVAVDVATGSKG